MTEQELQLLRGASPELLAFIEKERELEARKAFFAALCAFQAECPVIGKEADAGAGSFHYKYADQASIKQIIAPLLAKNGLSLSLDTRERDSGYEMICRVHHVGGWTQKTTVMISVDQKARMNDTQKSGSALAYGTRYAVNAALFVVAGKDDDAQSMDEDAQRPTGYGSPQSPPYSYDPQESNLPGSYERDSEDTRKITEKQRNRLYARINALNLEEAKIRQYCEKTWGSDRFSNLTREQYQKLDEIIDRKESLSA